MNVTIITMLVHFFTIGVASASRIKGGMRTLIEGPKERNLEDPAFSMPPQPIDDHNHDIKELLANEGFDAGAISHITTALDLSGARMTSGSDAKYWCASILEELFDFLLFSAAVEDAITLLICNREDEGTTTSTTTIACRGYGGSCEENEDCCSYVNQAGGGCGRHGTCF